MRNKILLAAVFALSPLSAFAHVTLAEPGALPGAQYQARFHVGHGCDGAPTTALSIVIPDGLADVQPVAKPGWTLQTTRAGTRISAVTWTGGTLAANTPDEFAVTMTLPARPVTLAFTATQTCGAKVENWNELPVADGHRLKNPAPLLTVSPTPAKAPDNSMPGMKM